jgi:hypothetical protein
MKTTSLQSFVDKRSAAGRLGFGDLRRLQRDVLPEGPRSREEVGALIALDKVLERFDDAWPGYLEAAVMGFVVSAAGPTGCLDRGTEGWLATALSSARPATAQAIARAVLLKVRSPGDALRGIAKPAAKRRAKVMASATGLTSRKRSKVVEPPPSTSGSITFQWGEIRMSSPMPPQSEPLNEEVWIGSALRFPGVGEC